ncbi:MAG: hypothetical protein LBD78_00935 [Spirochaetaceae bacterium]|nr:hypothetical protein [Spirochaetaceae bacterium]
MSGLIKKHLKPQDEQMLKLVFRQKQPLKAVAVRLNLSLSAVKSRVSRLRQKNKHPGQGITDRLREPECSPRMPRGGYPPRLSSG